jgi:magnesium-transporting ATPase (P-type)
MITGDNTLTGSNISYKCGISNYEKQMIIIDWDNNRMTELQFIFHNYDKLMASSSDKPVAESYI